MQLRSRAGGPLVASWVLWLLASLANPSAFAKGDCSTQPLSFWKYEIIAEYPHDPTGYTQGIVYENRCTTGGSCKDIFYESMGMYGESDVRISYLDNGAVEKRTPMGSQWFGEGLVKQGDKLYQITWQGPTGFIYSTKDLSQVGTFKTPLADGWGATADGTKVVFSDGSDTLTWTDPANGFAKVKSVKVRAGGRPVYNINELEMVDGEIWANLWQTDCIARICPQTGKVVGWLLMQGLRDSLAARNLPNGGKYMDVLNGIAYDATRKRVFVTGKYWPRVFAIKPVRISNTSVTRRMASSCLRPPESGRR